MPVRRSDRDFTHIDRFFEGVDPADADPGDLYPDTDVQSLWCSVVGYLRLVKALEFEQQFLRTENLAALASVHLGDEYPRIHAGIVQSVSEILQDDFAPEGSDELRRFWNW